VTVLDFGLAKLADSAVVRGPADEMASHAATVMSPAAMSAAGMILGTAAYMSPEQARGRPVDKRTDVWAFGAVLYEMLTARRAFAGDDVAETIASVMKSTPDWAALPPEVPPGFAPVARSCIGRAGRTVRGTSTRWPSGRCRRSVRRSRRRAHAQPRPSAAQPTGPVQHDMQGGGRGGVVLLRQHVEQESLAVGTRDETLRGDVAGQAGLEEHLR
jgi:serine/threonine protein kinase